MEHRWGRRIACGTPVRLTTAGALIDHCRLRDVSMSGAFIETTLELPMLARISLTVLRAEPQAECEISASVVRLARDGVGVEWCETPAGTICALLGCKTRCAAAMAPHCDGIT